MDSRPDPAAPHAGPSAIGGDSGASVETLRLQAEAATKAYRAAVRADRREFKKRVRLMAKEYGLSVSFASIRTRGRAKKRQG